MKKVKKFWPFILIAIVVLVFFLPVLFGKIPFPGDLLVNINPYKTQGYLGFAAGGYPNKAQGMDIISEIYPWRFFSVNQLKEGAIPFWNPYNFSGNPQMADFQTAIFYPINLLYLILPFKISWTIIIILQPLLAAVFMYLFLRRGIGLKDFPSFIGAVSFAFCSYMTVWIEYGNIGATLLWLPLALLFTKYFFNKLNVFNFLGIVIILSIAILAGYIQGVFYIYLLCFFYYAYLTFSVKGEFKKHKKNFLFLLSLFLPLLITSFQLLPTLQLFSESTRGAYTLLQIEKNLAPFSYWITIVFPDFFGNPATRNYWIDGTYIERVMYSGVVILFFAIYSLISKIKILEKRFFLLAGVISLIIATNIPFVKYFYLIPIPLVSTTIPTRELSLFIFSVIVLGAIGLEHFLNTKELRPKIIGIFLALLVCVWGVVLFFQNTSGSLSLNLKITMHNLILPSTLIAFTILAYLIKTKYKKSSLVLITILVIFDLFYFFNKITPFSPPSLIYPQTPIVSYLQKNAGINRFWGYGSAYVPANFQTVDYTYSPEGNDPLHILRYGELLSTSLNGRLPKSLPRPDANVAGGYGTDDLKNNFYRKRILDLLGIKYILHQRDLADAWQEADFTTFPKEQFRLIHKVYPLQVYENINALPRFFITGDYVLAKNKTQALSLIYSPNLKLETTLILEEPPGLNIDPKSKGEAELISYRPNKILIRTLSSGNALLFLSDNYYKEWEVKIDGKPSVVLLADYTFRAVSIPKGDHVVEFYYNAKSFKLGLLISITSVLLIVLIAVYVKIMLKAKSKNELN